MEKVATVSEAAAKAEEEVKEAGAGGGGLGVGGHVETVIRRRPMRTKIKRQGACPLGCR